MLLDLQELCKSHDLHVTGVLHVGAHHGQEFDVYEAMGVDKLIFFEPLPKTFQVLSSRLHGRATLVNVALGSKKGSVDMWVEENNAGQSSSVLEPKIHLTQYPGIRFNDRVSVEMITLDSFMEKCPDRDEYNLLNMDVQGYELEVLKGAVETIPRLCGILTEVNRAELYYGAVQVTELSTFLATHGFVCVAENWEGGNWGDAFYVRR